MTWASEVAADSPREHWRFVSDGSNEIGAGITLNEAGSGSYAGSQSPDYGADAIISGESNACYLADPPDTFYNGAGFYKAPPSWFNSATAFSIELVFSLSALNTDRSVLRFYYKHVMTSTLVVHQQRGCGLEITAANTLTFWAADPTGGLKRIDFHSPTAIALGVENHVVATWDGSNLRLYMNGTEADSVGCTAISRAYDLAGSGYPNWALYVNGVTDRVYSGFDQCAAFSDYTIDDLVLYDTALSSTRVAAHYAATGLTPPAATYSPALPITWDIKDEYAPYLRIVWNFADTYAPSLPITWDIKDEYGPALPIRWEIPDSLSPSLPIAWSIIDPAHIASADAKWGLSVAVDGTDVSSLLVDQARIDAEEDSSTTSQVSFLPAAGTIDPATYENKTITIDFVGRDTDGTVLYLARRFTGLVSRAEYLPRDGVLIIYGTTDLQGTLESMTRSQIDALITDAQWSEFVFDDTADGWQYARDRLSTRPAEIHIDPHGFLTVSNWAAGTPDITFNDSTRFDDTLVVERASRRDLLNTVRVNMDFRFSRLRQRDITVRIDYPYNPCEYMLNAFNVMQRSQVVSAADNGQWQRVSDIAYQPFFPPGTYLCNNGAGPFFPVVFAGAGVDYSALCIGASWKSARRWAQTVTETAIVTVLASDSITAVGEFGLEESYGIESEYDATGWESLPFSGARAGSTLNSAEDYVIDADDEADKTRDDYESAQVCAIAKAKATILGRHRGNRVRFSPVYRPDIDLSQTIRVNSTYLQATGKVFAYSEVFSVPTGDLDIEVTLALSRHGGSGLAVDDPLDPVATPDAPEETPPDKVKTLGYHIGGDPTSPPQDDDWEGFITNRQYPTDVLTLYQERLTVNYPEIEDAARNAASVSGTTEIDVAIPLDELTMSA